MRQAYHVELDEVRGDLARLARRAGQMMTNASTALWQADLPLAESVISGCGQVTTGLCPELDHRCVCLLALQAPVAAELRLVVSAMDAVGHLRRMGKLAGHIAKITRMKHPLVALPEDLEPVFARMAQLSTTLAQEAVRRSNTPSGIAPRSWAAPSRRWPRCTARSFSGSARRSGRTASSKQSTQYRWAGITRVLPTTPSRSRARPASS
jgi:phosphate transport system protein